MPILLSESPQAPQFPGLLQSLLACIVLPTCAALSLLLPLRDENRIRTVGRTLVAAEFIATFWLILQYGVTLNLVKQRVIRYYPEV